MVVGESTPTFRADLERIAAYGLPRSRMAGRVFRVTGDRGILALYAVKSPLVLTDLYALDIQAILVTGSLRTVQI